MQLAYYVPNVLLEKNNMNLLMKVSKKTYLLD